MDEVFESLRILFANGFMVQQNLEESPTIKKMLGRGVFEVDLEACGYTKKQLKKYCHAGVMKKTTTRYKGGWRNTYVLLGSK